MSRQLKFRTWLGKRFWFFDLSTGFNNENKDVCSDPEQFTGLLDKNGKEIFEGDLIEVCENKKGALVVEFKNQYVGGWILSHGDDDLSLGARRPHQLEIIGNIHENGDLIK